jgi:hypothetical protein
MIVVIGSMRLLGSGEEADAAGLAASIAASAAGEGARVELIGKLGDDPAGDAVLLALARRNVGHVAVLRDPARATSVVNPPDEAVDPDAPDATETPAFEGPVLEAADAGLALRYLPQIAVIVTVHLAGDVLAEAVSAASWAETDLIVVVQPDAAPPDGLPADAVTLAVPDLDESAAGAAIGRYAAALDRGAPAQSAYAALVESVSV